MTQTRLFAKEFPRRPRSRDEAIERRALELLIPDVTKWLDGDGGAHLAADLAQAIRYGNDDGYSIAQEMDRAGYSPDAKLVEILDGISNHRYQALKEAQRECVKDHDLRLSIAVGDPVLVVAMGKEQTGEVTSHHADSAEYTVFIPALGHVQEGLGTKGMVYGFEDVTAVEP